MNIRRRKILGRENSKCKDPAADMGLECSRNGEKASVAGAKLASGRKEGDEVRNVTRAGEGITWSVEGRARTLHFIPIMKEATGSFEPESIVRPYVLDSAPGCRGENTHGAVQVDTMVDSTRWRV